MVRLTRAEQQARTRTELLSVAREQFLTAGYAATSLDGIAATAGYSKGAVYSNFKDKPTLCGAVLEEIHRDKIGELAALTAAAMTFDDVDERVDAIGAWVEATAGDIGWTMLELEFVVLSRHDRKLNAMIVGLRERANAMVVEMLEPLFNELLAPPADAETQFVDDDAALPTLPDLADLLLSTGIGLGIQRAVDPRVSVQPAVDALRAAMRLMHALTEAPSSVE
ncbi:putative TetR family transcriptional regulator [Gordonia effusa NBRC 100432]|uniref:Putative TetR family transcriptional regulator n=1 Tax=Gordonia effusa NBRC 100432 TaxID=1077974 RepID=H0QUZ5_9ACTN|nr:TetR/AcrR family transcriptional regulator [Gordonia effusa]GAB16646.1 putative TetR family transcriptional regulator [Gordonia effusa NBRC 100432]